ncbi:natriuretic peptides A-like [Gopherus flavomarginatus]|uniref:natriuretic peptides A-like n=1 Tax=Gopherus flavomarginatus TaxID=286002 RepID=UPI0021CBC62A|nr:natriuretic peptides A-like [Gopherus flavomarginatus]
MGSLTAATLRFPLVLLLLSMKPQGRGKAHPVYSSASAAELADFKTLLDRLEDKLPLEAAETGLSQEMNEQNEEAPGDASRPLAPRNSDYVRSQREGLTYGRNSWELPEKPPSALRSKLRALLNSPRSMRRFSDCFGQRIDRIGAQSGLGCNSYRVRGRGNG